MFFFLLAIWDFIFILGLFYTFLIFWIAFIGIQLLEDVVVLKRTKFFGVPLGLVLQPLSLDPPCQLDIFGHYGYPLCMQRKGWHPQGGLLGMPSRPLAMPLSPHSGI